MTIVQMRAVKDEIMNLSNDGDIVAARQRTRTWAAEQGLSLVDQTKLVTAASELARNTVTYGGGGQVHLVAFENGPHRGVQLTFRDTGPGIADIAQAMQDGFSSGSGMGLGLGGSRRLVQSFEIESTPGQGTKVTIARWK